ncbi:MAG: CHAT domain-containing protein [Acidobacteria bacterium]|nr:CHAT domain-containing protein [Acidobacteriota bacterium]
MTRRGAAAPGQDKPIIELEERVVTLERALARRIDGTAAQVAREITWRDVQQRLSPGDAAVEFARFRLHDGIKFTGDTRYVALVVTPGHARPQLVELGSAKVVKEALEDLRSLTGARHAQYASGDVGRIAAATLWKPLVGALRGARRVFLSPDGELHKVSWGMLRVLDDEPLIVTHDIRVVSSTKDLLRTPRPTGSRSAVLVGNPTFTLPQSSTSSEAAAAREVPAAPAAQIVEKRRSATACADWGPLVNTEAEIRDIAATLHARGWKTDVRLGVTATEEAVKAVSAPRVLHLATHGCFKPDPPRADAPRARPPRQLDAMLRSFLAFAGANRSAAAIGDNDAADDGELTAYEASALNLQGTELVVMSACETGLGEITNGEGVLGLRRAFQIAGAEAVLMSLWNVPDEETTELMKRFYNHWIGGMDKHAALRRAQLEVRELVRMNPKYGKSDLPFYWGAFVLVGP